MNDTLKRAKAEWRQHTFYAKNKFKEHWKASLWFRISATAWFLLVIGLFISAFVWLVMNHAIIVAIAIWGAIGLMICGAIVVGIYKFIDYKVRQ